MGAISGAASFGVPTAWIGNNERLALLSLARRERHVTHPSLSYIRVIFRAGCADPLCATSCVRGCCLLSRHGLIDDKNGLIVTVPYGAGIGYLADGTTVE